MKFLFVCGGTAGHINPALAIAGRLRELFSDAQFMFVGSGREMENRLIPAEGFELRNITMTGFSRSLSIAGLKKNINTVKNLVVSAGESRRILDEFKPDVVIGTGGYVCYPVITAAAKKGIPTVIHESNAVPGLTTKMVSGVADKVLVAFPGVQDRYKKPQNVVVTGTPVRGDFTTLSREAARKKLGILDDKPLVVSFWGSLGADGMNGKMADFIRLAASSDAFHHIHATGGGDAGVKKMRARLSERKIDNLPEWIDLRPYISNMGEVMTAADVVLCRSGASTLAELTALGRASILVPSPNVTNNHQEKNAREVEKAGGAAVITEAECTGESLYTAVLSLLGDRKRLDAMEKGAHRLGVADACEKIVETVLKLIN